MKSLAIPLVMLVINFVLSELVLKSYKTRQARTSLTKKEDILKRLIENCSKLYNCCTEGDPEVLNSPLTINNSNNNNKNKKNKAITTTTTAITKTRCMLPS